MKLVTIFGKYHFSLFKFVRYNIFFLYLEKYIYIAFLFLLKIVLFFKWWHYIIFLYKVVNVDGEVDSQNLLIVLALFREFLKKANYFIFKFQNCFASLCSISLWYSGGCFVTPYIFLHSITIVYVILF